MTQPPDIDALNQLPLDETFRRLAATGLIRRLFEIAREEDLGPSLHDLTSLVATPADSSINVELRAREDMVVAGVNAVPLLADVFDLCVAPEVRVTDGETASAGDVIMRFTGVSAQAMLALERPMLNLIGRLSGVATLTQQFVNEIRGAGPASIVDTRKTTPGLRALEKYAVRCGGGLNHRLGLFDAVLVKDNHLADVPDNRLADFARSIAARARTEYPAAFIEFEVDRLDQLDALLTLESGVVDIILLDNMRPNDLSAAVRRRNETGATVLLEASGGVTLASVREVASTGVDRIAVGALTHSVRSMDVGLDAG